MDFTIVTPSFKQLDYLACCIASVADQAGITVEHLVQDGGTPGFDTFSKKMSELWPDRPGYRRIMISEKDQGMYDAINRGLKNAQGKICAYLNCDEQYLPGALAKVSSKFEANPAVEVFLGDVIVVGLDGSPICFRKMVRPGLAHTWTCHFAALTAGIFFRRKIIDQGMCFDTSYRAAADAEWFVRILRSGLCVGLLGSATSSFMEAGNNLGLSSTALAERERLTRSAPSWMRRLRPWWVLWHRIRRLATGAQIANDLTYEIYLPDRPHRNLVLAKKLRTTWPGRMWGY
ncbi:MAG: glycosyltransferase [Verrucomicrobia bacterium]|nr:glycosyltransferase [Verrucomicrobiota bacterium]